jgi:MAF protein
VSKETFQISDLKTKLARAGLRLVLASASPRRIELLEAVGLRVEVSPANIEEVAHPHLTPGEITLWNARAKAASISRALPEAVVIAADTLVAHEGAILGKPGSLEAAHSMLRRLSGATHEVFSGVWIQHGASGSFKGFTEVSRVAFRPLSDADIRRSTELTDPLDKAGAYAAQHDPLNIIAHIDGSRTNVIGLPMERLLLALAELLDRWG